MTHGFSRQDWIEYTTGTLNEARKSDFEAHLAGCEECAQAAQRLSAIDKRLSVIAHELLDSLPVKDSEVRDAFRDWQLRGSQQRPAEPQQLIWLELFLSHLLGRHTAVHAMRRAANDAAAESAETVTTGQWAAFVRSLSDVVGDLCGEPAAQLLHAIGCSAL